jgi:hypothetical protein
MSETKTIDTIFSDNNLPWLLNKNYRHNSEDIKKSTGIEFEKIGRVLACHLFIEHYLTKLIELKTPVQFDWDESKLTFAQKLKLVKKFMFSLKKTHFYQGIETINKIRNKLSHNIEASIEINDINVIKAVLKSNFEESESESHNQFEYSDLAIIELFTSIFCAYVHGLCDGIVRS